MTIFNAARFGAVAVSPGELFSLFSSTDVLAAGTNSQVMTPAAPGPVARQAISFTIQCTTASPTDQIIIYGSNTPPTAAGPQNGLALYTSNNKQSDSYVDTSGLRFYWAQLVTESGTLFFSIVASIA
jgi:hypothetical protein